jgi:hypothetical protein
MIIRKASSHDRPAYHEMCSCRLTFFEKKWNAKGGLGLFHDSSALVSLGEFDFDRGDISCLALFAEYLGTYVHVLDFQFAVEETSSADLDYIDSLGNHSSSSFY